MTNCTLSQPANNKTDDKSKYSEIHNPAEAFSLAEATYLNARNAYEKALAHQEQLASDRVNLQARLEAARLDHSEYRTINLNTFTTGSTLAKNRVNHIDNLKIEKDARKEIDRISKEYHTYKQEKEDAEIRSAASLATDTNLDNGIRRQLILKNDAFKAADAAVMQSQASTRIFDKVIKKFTDSFMASYLYNNTDGSLYTARSQAEILQEIELHKKSIDNINAPLKKINASLKSLQEKASLLQADLTEHRNLQTKAAEAVLAAKTEMENSENILKAARENLESTENSSLIPSESLRDAEKTTDATESEESDSWADWVLKPEVIEETSEQLIAEIDPTTEFVSYFPQTTTTTDGGTIPTDFPMESQIIATSHIPQTNQAQDDSWLNYIGVTGAVTSVTALGAIYSAVYPETKAIILEMFELKLDSFFEYFLPQG